VESQASFGIPGWRMKIVVADPIFLTEEYKKRLEALGELEIYNSVPASLEEFIDRIKDAEIENVEKFAKGRPQNVVNPSVLKG